MISLTTDTGRSTRSKRRHRGKHAAIHSPVRACSRSISDAHQGCGSRSASGTTVDGPMITRAARFLASTCHMSSRQRPHGGITPSAVTATTSAISDSRAFNISATAACSAQNPMLHAVSMQTPV